VDNYNITIDSAIDVLDGDKLVYTVPKVMAVPNGVTCQPGSFGVTKVTCTNNGRTVQVTLDTVTQSLGKFEF